MRVLRLSASVLVITGLAATSAAPTPEMRLDHAGRPMPTEIHESRDKTYLITERSWPSESAYVDTRLTQNVGPDEPPSPTGTRPVAALAASLIGIGAELPVVSGWKWVLVPDMQVDSAGNRTIPIDMKSRSEAQNESGGVVVNITRWTLGRENGLSAGVMVASALAAVLGCSCTSLWCLRRMRESLDDAVEQMQKGKAGLCPPPWTVPVRPSEMWAVPAPPSPLSPRTASDTVYSLGHHSGMRACPSWRTAYDPA